MTDSSLLPVCRRCGNSFKLKSEEDIGICSWCVFDTSREQEKPVTIRGPAYRGMKHGRTDPGADS